MTDIRQFVRQIVKAFSQKDRDGICNLIMLEENSPGIGDLHKTLYELSESSIRALVQEVIPDSRQLRDFVTNYLIFSIASALDSSSYVSVYELLSSCYGSFLVLFTAQDAQWLTPLLMNLSYSLVDWAIMADKEQPKAKKLKISDAAAKHLTRVLNIVISDRVPNLEESKKIAIYYVSNLTFRAYFKLRSTRLMPTTLANIANSGAQLSDYPMSQQVTHRYYLGRYSLYQLDLRRAEAHLAFAFRNCPMPARDKDENAVIYRNSRLILIYLTACRLCLGRFPSRQLLQIYGLEPYFAPLMHAIRVGNLELLNNSLNSPELMGWLVKKELFFLLKEKLVVLCWRSLIRKICIVSRSPSDTQLRVQLPTLLNVVQTLTRDPTYDIGDVECIAASLLDQGYIKGYIHSAKKILVLGSKNPFPTVYSVSVLGE
ncbi:hypothetical protein EMPS_08406 [Entomortierella parvispora]|uniref:PCI domain-containing protein n=1 Tax=Entomortierella parvispora TaxID=205924 RepID=A0A9P3HG66_9FUNG|nr:hypothetical protein EMPS_08406 [Entomortierella parvispora]